MLACPDLRQFADNYTLGRDEAAGRGPVDPWMLTLEGRYGTVYPFGPGRLAVEVVGDKKLVHALARVPGARVEQDGDDEWAVSFPAGQLLAVARLVGLRLGPPAVQK